MAAWTLHSSWTAMAPYRVRIALALKGLSYETAAINLRKGEQHTPQFRAINPQGMIPALDIGDGELMTQSLAILEWLDEAHPQPPLLPKGPRDRARVRAMISIVAVDIHPMITTRIGLSLVELGLEQKAVYDWMRRWLAEGFDALEPQVARHAGRFAFGDAPTLADCCLVPQAYVAGRFQLDLAPWPAIAAAAERASQHPAFQAAHPDNQPDAKPS